MDTEVVIWSSKVLYSPPPASDHAPWGDHAHRSDHTPWGDHAPWSQDQPEVGWMQQRETEPPLPVSNYAVDTSTVLPYDR